MSKMKDIPLERVDGLRLTDPRLPITSNAKKIEVAKGVPAKDAEFAIPNKRTFEKIEAAKIAKSAIPIKKAKTIEDALQGHQKWEQAIVDRSVRNEPLAMGSSISRLSTEHDVPRLTTIEVAKDAPVKVAEFAIPNKRTFEKIEAAKIAKSAIPIKNVKTIEDALQGHQGWKQAIVDRSVCNEPLAMGSSISRLSTEHDVPRMTRRQIETLDLKWRDLDIERTCPLCKCTITGVIPWNEHLGGRTHSHYVDKALGKNPPPLEFYKSTKRSSARYNPKDFSDVDRPVVKKIEVKGAKMTIYRCEPCDVEADLIELYKEHIAGRKHKLRLEEAKHINAAIWKESCFVCAGRLKKACTACNNTYWIGMCSHSIHQCCASQLKQGEPCPVCEGEEPWKKKNQSRVLKPED